MNPDLISKKLLTDPKTPLKSNELPNLTKNSESSIDFKALANFINEQNGSIVTRILNQFYDPNNLHRIDQIIPNLKPEIIFKLEKDCDLSLREYLASSLVVKINLNKIDVLNHQGFIANPSKPTVLTGTISQGGQILVETNNAIKLAQSANQEVTIHNQRPSLLESYPKIKEIYIQIKEALTSFPDEIKNDNDKIKTHADYPNLQNLFSQLKTEITKIKEDSHIKDNYFVEASELISIYEENSDLSVLRHSIMTEQDEHKLGLPYTEKEALYGSSSELAYKILTKSFTIGEIPSGWILAYAESATIALEIIRKLSQLKTAFLDQNINQNNLQENLKNIGVRDFEINWMVDLYKILEGRSKYILENSSYENKKQIINKNLEEIIKNFKAVFQSHSLGASKITTEIEKQLSALKIGVNISEKTVNQDPQLAGFTSFAKQVGVDLPDQKLSEKDLGICTAYKLFELGMVQRLIGEKAMAMLGNSEIQAVGVFSNSQFEQRNQWTNPLYDNNYPGVEVTDYRHIDPNPNFGKDYSETEKYQEVKNWFTQNIPKERQGMQVLNLIPARFEQRKLQELLPMLLSKQTQESKFLRQSINTVVRLSSKETGNNYYEQFLKQVKEVNDLSISESGNSCIYLAFDWNNFDDLAVFDNFLSKGGNLSQEELQKGLESEIPSLAFFTALNEPFGISIVQAQASGLVGFGSKHGGFSGLSLVEGFEDKNGDYKYTGDFQDLSEENLHEISKSLVAMFKNLTLESQTEYSSLISKKLKEEAKKPHQALVRLEMLKNLGSADPKKLEKKVLEIDIYDPEYLRKELTFAINTLSQSFPELDNPEIFRRDNSGQIIAIANFALNTLEDFIQIQRLASNTSAHYNPEIYFKKALEQLKTSS